MFIVQILGFITSQNYWCHVTLALCKSVLTVSVLESVDCLKLGAGNILETVRCRYIQSCNIIGVEVLFELDFKEFCPLKVQRSFRLQEIINVVSGRFDRKSILWRSLYTFVNLESQKRCIMNFEKLLSRH